MIDKLTPDMVDMTKGAVGKYTVQLFDAETGEKVHEQVKHNMINPAYISMLYEPCYVTTIANGRCGLGLSFLNFPSSNSSEGYANTLSIFESAETPEKNLYMLPEDAVSICSTDLYSSTKGDNPVKANVNQVESYARIEVSDEGNLVYRKHLVIDYLTHEGNGKFNNIAVSVGAYNSFSLRQIPGMTSSNNYYNSSFCELPSCKLNKTTWGQCDNGNECGPISVESDHTFWICNTLLGRQDSNINTGELTFYKFDISKGYLVCTQKVTLSGSPSEMTSLSSSCPRYGLRFKGKFYVFIGKNHNYKDKMFVYSETGSYEKSVTIKASGYTNIGDNGYGGLIATPQAMIICTSENSYDQRSDFRAFNENGDTILHKNNMEFHKICSDFVQELYGQAPSTNSVYHIKPVPYYTMSGKLMILLCHQGQIGSAYGYYDPATNELKALPRAIAGTLFYTMSLTCNTGEGIFGNNLISFNSYNIDLGCAIPWWSWCHLSSPITKTSSTTMKIQYDVEVPILLPCTPTLYKK